MSTVQSYGTSTRSRVLFLSRLSSVECTLNLCISVGRQPLLDFAQINLEPRIFPLGELEILKSSNPEVAAPEVSQEKQ